MTSFLSEKIFYHGWTRIHPTRPLAATTVFGLRREAKRHAALGSIRPYEKRCRRCALPPQSKSLSSVREIAELYYGGESGEHKV